MLLERKEGPAQAEGGAGSMANLKTLQNAFEVFNASSQTLAMAYERLERKVAALTVELASARAEKEALARKLEALATQRSHLAELGEMSARLAHQIRTPLASAVLYLSNLENDSLNQEQRKRFLDRARERLWQLERTTNNMLAYARQGPGNGAILKLGWLLEQFRQVMEPQLLARNALLTVENRCDGSVELKGDRDALLGALINLGSNALEACGEAPRLHLAAGVRGEEIVIRLDDNGCGLEGVDKERLFQPFYTTRPGGTGLGLAVARAVVEGVNGTLTLTDRADGGARVEIRLPCISRPESERKCKEEM